MLKEAALDQALQLSLIPSLVRTMQSSPLPSGMDLLLAVLAGDRAAEQTAERSSGKPLKTIRSAAEFYAEQILFAPSASAYRTLGAEVDASRAQLRTHLALLVRWLHPDNGLSQDNGEYLDRVMRAWRILRSAERRADYDRALRALAAAHASASAYDAARVSAPFFRTQVVVPSASACRRRLRLRRFLLYAIGLAAVAVAIGVILVFVFFRS